MNPLETTLRRIAAVLGWSAVLAIAFATLAPIGSRPHVSATGPDVERFLAFLLLSGTLSLAYPKRFGLILVLTIGLVIGLEAAQSLEPTRHGRPHDAVIKIFGAVAGVALGILADRFARSLLRAR
ncbi:MAG TPA: hypothetical protein VGN82_00145 [Bosea sp. (in: a-proteobacteria)]|uniref:hypothetical protein n=1 Tax=Bosea sp. (in: a-proteobacteria) TaxID=1871050 RepID=UPI002E105080|nr:hypothetical protein [Bosea sp. (in: a-proteobacteria)]